MNITATASTQYATQTSQTTRNERTAQVNTPSQTPKHTVQALDEKANKILDKLLEGMDKSTQASMKFSLDWRLNMRRDEEGNPVPDENGFFLIDNSIGNSEEEILKKIDFVIADLQEPGQTDMLGVLDVLKDLKKLYTNNYTPLDIKA